MSETRKFMLKTEPADFAVLLSGIFTIAREMGVNMERTARAPIYYSAHDFTNAILNLDCEIVALAEYIPVLNGATPFAAKAVRDFFKSDVNEGDVFLVNDPYTLDAGNQMADWTIVYPIFVEGEHMFWVANKAHQQDTGGGVPGGYNPNAIDVYAEGLRIPPLRIFSKGKEIKDVFSLVMKNVRIPDTQRGDLLSMIGAAKVGERRVNGLVKQFGKDKFKDFIEDLLNYGEFMMREEIAKIPDGTYHSEITGNPGSSPVVCDITVKGSEMIVDFSQSGPMVQEYVNSPIANTHSSTFQAVMNSIGKKIQYRCGGCYRPIEIKTKPGTITHAVHPFTHGNCTNFIAKQIIEAVWAALGEAIPQAVPGGWGSINYWVFSGIDERRNEGFGSPDFLACASGAGAIWGTDGWPTNGPQICSGTLYYPEIEVAEGIYPMRWEKWEWSTDSGGPGKWRGGCGVDNVWVVESEKEPVYVAYAADPYDYNIAPAIAGGKMPPLNRKELELATGAKETSADTRSKKFYVLRKGDKAIDFTQGGCGVGDPLDRDITAVQEDVRDGLVSAKSAEKDYGVIINPATFEVDIEKTGALRQKMRA
ncbi:MAG: hydantoinase B/oxoprolinase family protein [Deltaproteobacteria bacterium]|nr:hydantoinase B/oxoprolinase family protein [Deltaproteobacteria bacterium]